MPLSVLGLVVITIGMVLLVGYVLVTLPRSGERRQYTRLARQNAELNELVDRLKDIAWDERELDPNLSTIIIDEIRSFERRQRGTDLDN